MKSNNLLFTGASGFVGRNIRPFLNNDYNITTLGLSSLDDYSVDLANEEPRLNEKYNIVLHAASKVHSDPKTSGERKAFMDINFKGTKNLCSALEKTGLPYSFIFISTVAVYGLDFGELITEDYPLNGKTPYAQSKILAESFLKDWCFKHGVNLSIIRPSLIAGPNPPGNLGKMIRGIKSGRYLSISGGGARKSILMVKDIANLVPLLAKKGGIYNICDSEQLTIRDLENIIARQLGKSSPISVPYFLAEILAGIGDLFGGNASINSLKLGKITRSLTFSNMKARQELNWEPLNVRSNFKIY